jgi:drug/metabolite transporter (DMT)-like permease
MIVRKNHLDGLAVSLLLGCCLLWGFQQALAKATLAELPPVFQAALRVAGATALLWLWCLWRGIALFKRDGSLKAGLLAGTLFTAEFACMYLGLQYTTASRLTLFVYTSPFWVAVLVPLFVKTEQLSRLQWLGLMLAFGGVSLALRDGLLTTAPSLQWQGDFLALAAGMCWGLTTVVIRSSGLTRVSAEKLLFYQVGVGAAVLPLLSLLLGETWVWRWSPFVATSLFVQTVVGAFASYLAWMWMLGRYPATKISVFVFLTPVFAMVSGALWLKEPVTIYLIAALAMVAGGIVLVNLKPSTMTGT